MIEFLEEIQEQFEKYYPREGCGVLAVSKGEMKWIPCDNVATNEDDFIIDSRQYLDISRRYDIVGIVHNHPDASCEPSQADIKACNAIGKPYYIFSYPEMEMQILKPNKTEKDLYGRDYEFGVADCLEAGIDYYKTQNIELPNRIPFEDNWWEKGLDYFNEEYIKTWGFHKVEGNLQKNDLLIFAIHSRIGNHCGVYLGDDIFYHHAQNRLSCRENLYPFWKKHIIGAYRYEA
jgi:proteasome lid subunit RPN8/RPN11